jgi:hypothetical protein
MSPAYSPELAPDVQRALARWPNVPAAFGWLRLDRRGRWFVPDGPITHPGTIAFLHRHYGADETGRWFVQNGPQRAYVALDLAPWVFSLDGFGRLCTPSGRRVAQLEALVLTPCGETLIVTELGLGNVLDRDLAHFTSLLESGAEGGALQEVLDGRDDVPLHYLGQRLSVLRLTVAALAARFGFQREPAAPV